MSTISSSLLGSCPIRVNETDQPDWLDVVADLIDAWETAFEIGDPFWISAVTNRIQSIAEASGGLIEVVAPSHA